MGCRRGVTVGGGGGGGGNILRVRVFGAVRRGHSLVDVVGLGADDVALRRGDCGGRGRRGCGLGSDAFFVDGWPRVVLDGIQAVHYAGGGEPGFGVVVPTIPNGRGENAHALQRENHTAGSKCLCLFLSIYTLIRVV